jgi:hypothetical protein
MQNFWLILLNLRVILASYIINVFFCYSAGVGRTGTLIAIDIALSQASKEKQVDIPKIIVDMRRQRMKMVQTVVRDKNRLCWTGPNGEVGLQFSVVID